MKISTIQTTGSILFLFFFSALQAQVEIKPDGSIFDSKVTINDTLENNGLIYPLTDGNAGQLLTTDGAGRLGWSTASDAVDYDQFYEYVCDTPIEYNIEDDFGSTECGTLYDSGGANSNYSNNEDLSFLIFGESEELYTRIILQSLAIEENRDTLFIGEKVFVADVNAPDTLLFNGQESVEIQFKSDGVNNEAGFIISWDRYKYIEGNSLPASMLGFFFNAEKSAIGGGVEQDNAWSTIGDRSILFGFGGKADGSSSSAIGRGNEATGSASSAFGYFTDARGNNSSAFGNFNDARGSSSSAFGRGNVATGSSSSAFGNFTDAIGNNSSAFGNYTTSNLYQMTTIGTYNNTTVGSSTSWIPTEPVFMIGNGQSNGSRSTALTILKNGNTGIGTMTPTERLEIVGKIKIGSLETIEDGGSNTISFNSNLTPTVDNQRDLGSSTFRWDDVYATNGTINTSDARQKTNIKKLDYGLEEVMQLKPVRFQWKGKQNEAEKLGLIAQDLLEVIPEVVKTHDWMTTEEGTEGQRKKVAVKTLGVYYADIIPVLIHSIQEQQDQIEEQQDRMDSKDERIEKLEDRLAKLEAQISTLHTAKVKIENNTTLDKAQLLQKISQQTSLPLSYLQFIPLGVYTLSLKHSK